MSRPSNGRPLRVGAVAGVNGIVAVAFTRTPSISTSPVAVPL